MQFVEMMGGAAILRAVSLATLLVCCTACPYEDILLSGHKARAYDVEGYTPHVPVTSTALRQQSKTLYTKYPLANYQNHHNLRHKNTNLQGRNNHVIPSRVPPHLIRQRPEQYGHGTLEVVPARTRVPQHLVHQTQTTPTQPVNYSRGGRGPPPRHQPQHAIYKSIPQLAGRGPIIEVENESSYTPEAIHQTKRLPHVKSRYYEYFDELNSEFDD